MTVGMGTWAVVREPNAFTCTVLKGAAEFRIGTLKSRSTRTPWPDGLIKRRTRTPRSARNRMMERPRWWTA